MLYLNKEHIREIGTDWRALTRVVSNASAMIKDGQYVQPLKLYLRYGDKRNRIIAMPAYVGGRLPMAGIKWIASFPGNIHSGRPRASSVMILNEAGTGVVKSVISTSMVSEIRTAAVSGSLIRKYMESRKKDKYVVGIVGFGPIGRMHLQMVESLLRDRIEKVLLYDLKDIERSSIDGQFSSDIVVCASWEECFSDADIFITCTVSERPYVDRAPKAGALLLNVSLRDFRPETRKYMNLVIVDDWDEVCRENTDIENMHKLGLEKGDTVSISEVFDDGNPGLMDGEQTIMFNPMGMAVFDVAIGGYFYDLALAKGVGICLPE